MYEMVEIMARQNIATNGRAFVLSGMAANGGMAAIAGTLGAAPAIGVIAGALSIGSAYLADNSALLGKTGIARTLGHASAAFAVACWLAFLKGLI